MLLLSPWSSYFFLSPVLFQKLFFHLFLPALEISTSILSYKWRAFNTLYFRLSKAFFLNSNNFFHTSFFAALMNSQQIIIINIT